MAATESGDGHQRLATNQVPSVQVCGAVTEGTDGESMEVVSEAVVTADAGHPELICGSTPGLSEHGVEDNCVAAEKETEHKETEAAVVPSSAFTSPQNPSPSQSSFTTDQTFSTALVHGEPGSTSESGKEGTEVKTEEELELKGENVAVKDKSLEESPAGPDVTEDTDMDMTSDCHKEITNTDVNTDPAISTQEEKEAHACKPKVSTADDLDEMMDIGTVDQMEQEAQMKEGEGPNSAMDVESSRSPTTSDTVSAVEESNTVEEETDVKPTVLPPPAQENQVENVKAALDSVQSSSRPSSETMTSAGRRNSSPAAMMNGMKVVKLSIPKLDAERLRAAVQSIKSTPSPPLVKVKDEPVDEEYEQALISSASMASVKDEPNTAKEDLRIGSVFSVTPAAETQMLPTVNPSSMHMSCSHCKKSLMRGQTAFQRKGSSSLFCSTTCLTTSLPTVKGVTKICHNCQKLIFRPQDVILAPDAEGTMKEFCSQNCLTSFNYKKNTANYRRTATTKKPPTVAPPSLCSMCTRYCISKHEVILSGAVHKLCGDACFNRFRTVNNLSMAGCANCGSYCHNKPLTLKIDDSNKTLCNAECLTKYKEQTKITQPCSMCRTSHSLAEMVDNKNSDDSVNLFCSSSCVMAFKVQTVSASGARLNCDSCGKNTVPAYHLAMSDTSIRNFCTLPCVMVFQEKFKKTHKQVNVFTKLPIGSTQIQSVTPTQPQQDVSKEPPKLDCSQCTRSINFKPELIQIKSDEIPKGTEQSERKRPEASGSNVEEPVSPKRKMIHNPSRVTTENMVQVVGNLLRRVKQLEEKVNTMQNMNDKLQSDNITLKVALMKKMNRKKKPPGARVATTAAPEPPQDPPDNNMDKMVFVCSVDCSHEFKKANYVTSLCEYCKIEKITRDAKRINTKDCYFCSDGCKLLFRHDLTKSWGKHCHSCVYCHCVSKKLVTAQYGGSTEEFCSEDCRSKYTMLFCHVAKCDTCGRKGKLKQSLPMLGEVKHFCDLSCLLQFCSDKVATQGEVFKGTGEATPVIANVISLAGPPTGKSNASDRTAPQSTVSNFQSKNSGHVSIQTETVKPHPPSGPKILKNKALLCRPLVQNKGVSCKTQTADVEAQTDDVFPKIMVLPVPVPVYVPVPMNMYSQCTPKPVGLPLPLPVPMFLPVTMDSAERIIETIQEIKEKIPSDPFEAELILMAEMVAEQDEKNDKQERPKEKVAEKETERHEVPATDDHASTYSDDLDTDDLASFLNNWEDASSDAGLRSPSRSYAHEKIIDVPVGMPSEPYSEPPPPALPPMDVEADFTVETLEKMARLREQSQQPPSPPPATPRRRQAHRKAREKNGRKSQRSSKATETPCQRGSANRPTAVEVPKLKSQYGVDAWKRWIQWRQTQPNLEKPRFGSRPMELKEDVLRCTTAELSYGLCCFITEVKRPNGEPYSPDSLFYLCLGIQQYLFENGRVENIFMDRFYNKFSTEFTSMLRGFKPSITASGYIHSRVEEEFLWDCKQLGAYSPIVLLNTLLFFCCKYFGFTTVEQHRQLSFAHVMRCTKTNQNNTKTTFLRFYPPISINETDPGVPAKKRKEEEIKEDILEMMENTENPLRCPVRLYEFYLSKCSESVKQRTNLFYLHPERCCVPNSPLWFSSTALDDSTMEAMLIRILTVRELHLRTGKEGGIGQKTPDDPPFIPDEEEDEDSE